MAVVRFNLLYYSLPTAPSDIVAERGFFPEAGTLLRNT